MRAIYHEATVSNCQLLKIQIESEWLCSSSNLSPRVQNDSTFWQVSFIKTNYGHLMVRNMQISSLNYPAGRPLTTYLARQAFIHLNKHITHSNAFQLSNLPRSEIEITAKWAGLFFSRGCHRVCQWSRVQVSSISCVNLKEMTSCSFYTLLPASPV